MQTVPSRTHLSDARYVAVAVAECLHVDGCFEDAAQAWQSLAKSHPDDGESALKCAIALIACGRGEESERWLARAESLGLVEETAYIRGQMAWQGGHPAVARSWLRRAANAAPGSGKPLNALGVLAWKEGASKEAVEFFREAAKDRSDGEARLNEAFWLFSNGDAVPEQLVADAARLIPHQPGPHVLWSRVLRRAGHAEEAGRSLQRARMRRLPRSIRPREAAAKTTFTADAVIALCGTRLRIECRLAASTLPPPASFRLNAGCVVASDGTSRRDDGEYAIAADRWIRDAAGWTFDLRIEGTPVKPGVSFSDDEIELAGASAWFPLFDEVTLAPRLTWDLPDDAQAWWGDSPRGGVDALILIAPQRFRSAAPSRIGAVVVSTGATGDVAARHAAVVLGVAVETWNALLGDAKWPPPLLVVARPASQFCYTRADFVRAASGAVGESGSQSLLFHEAGHLWWGSDATAAREDEWITEGLSESIFHAWDPPRRKAYRTAAIDRLNRGEPETLVSLAELSRAGGATAAAVLRQKGGYFFAVLRRLLGDEPYRQFLRELYQSCRGKQITPWLVRALASGARKQCLHWYFAQWIDANGGLSFRFADVACDGNAVRFRLENRGVFSIGGPVVVELTTAGGASLRQELNLELGAAAGSFRAAARPLRLRADPEMEWYAARADHGFEMEGGR